MNESIASRLARSLLSASLLSLVAFTPSVAHAFCGDFNVEVGEECDDGNVFDGDCCNSNCKFDPVEMPCSGENQCRTGFCDGQGTCNTFINQGAPCDDGNQCTSGDVCNSDGFCGGSIDQGKPCDDGNGCTGSQGDTCNSDGFCGGPFLEQGSTCFQNNLCGGRGTCVPDQFQFLVCSGDPADCDGFDSLCNSAACNPDTAKCEVTQLDDGTPCDSGSTCLDPGACKNGECQQPPKDCSAFADACRDAFCDVEAGGCYTVPKEFGTPCDDGDACTQNTTCDNCADCAGGQPVDCSAFGDQCNTASCDSETGCFADPVQDGTECGDDNACTLNDVCTGGICDGTDVDCSEFVDACNNAFCNSQTGECQQVPVEVPTTCDDGDPCTENDACRGGVCAGQQIDCSGLDDDCVIGVCNGDSGGCTVTGREDGTGCNDGNACTTNDQCTGGQCGGTPVDCSQLDDQCNDGVCNAQTGQCEADPVTNNTSCNDGDPCTVTDVCTNGQCGGAPKDCSSFDGPCATGTCNLRTGACFAFPLEGGSPCNDGDACTTNDLCNDNAECNGTPKDCSASGNACNTGVCNGQTGNCESQPIGQPTSCDDGNACTTGDTCVNGSCVGTPKDCSNLDGQCTTGVCDAQSGQCVAQNAGNGTTCNDGDLCTTGDQCTRGICGGTPKDCSASGGSCTVGTCNPDTGQCVGDPAENGTTCNDGNLCTTGDQCTGGTCGGTPVVCPPSTQQCQESFCRTQDGQCGDRPVTNGTTCNDGNLCTTGDQCTAGTCGGSTKDCTNLDNACNVGVCNAQDGNCALSPRGNGTPCSDGNACTTGDQCTAGTCGGSTKDCTNLDNACNVGVCNAQVGNCAATPRENGTPCSDSNECTTGDHCTAGACGGAPKDCSSLDAPCKTGVCNTRSGNCETQNAGDNSPCDDGAFCTATDTCTGGACIGTGDPCPGTLACNGTCDEAHDTCNAASGTSCETDDNPCTDDVCDGEGTCGHPANDAAACDDGLYCTTGDHCSDAECIGSATCPQTDACSDTCDEANDACRTCGHPFSNTRCVVNAIVVLQGAIGIRDCELCTCDVNGDGIVNATDALQVLRTCVNLPVSLDCTADTTTTTTSTTTTTLAGGCEAELDGVVFKEKYSCEQSTQGGDPFCADLNVVDTIQFVYSGGGGFYQVKDVPDAGFVRTGIYDCATFTWTATSPDEYTEAGIWTFTNDATEFSGQSAYIATDQSYIGACNDTGARSPTDPPAPVPPDSCGP